VLKIQLNDAIRQPSSPITTTLETRNRVMETSQNTCSTAQSHQLLPNRIHQKVTADIPYGNCPTIPPLCDSQSRFATSSTHWKESYLTRLPRRRPRRLGRPSSCPWMTRAPPPAAPARGRASRASAPPLATRVTAARGASV
jgi:hypothetical protein